MTNPVGGIPFTPGDCSGNTIPLASRLAATGGFDFTVPMADGELNLNGNVAYNDGFTFTPDGNARQKAFTMFNATAMWTDSGGRFTVGL